MLNHLINIRFAQVCMVFVCVNYLAAPSASLAGIADAVQPPSDLRCELLKGAHVRNIRDAQPEFSWVINGQSDHSMQSAYQVQVAKAGDLFEQPLWDSGKAESKKSLFVSYKGAKLAVDTDYHWRVRAWYSDAKQTERLSAWSQPQRFTTASTFDEMASQQDLTTTAVSPELIKRLPSGKYLIDFGKSAFGYLELHIDADKSGKIGVNFAERGSQEGALKDLHEKSSVRYYEVDLLVNESFDVYRVHPPRDHRNTLANKAIPIPGRFGRVAPFRYVELDAGDIELSDIRAKFITVHYPFDDYSSFFTSSSDTLNQIWDLCKYSMKATSFAGIYVDGDRERIPYEADAYINQLSHYLVDDEYSLARYSHEYLLEHPTWPTEWKQHSVMMAWADWMYTGDIESVKKNFALLQKEKTLEYLARDSDGLLVSYPFKNDVRPKIRDLVDWPKNERDNFDFQKVNSVVNGFYYLNLTQMASMADALSMPDVAGEYREKAAAVYEAFNRVFYNSEAGLYVDGEGSSHSSFHANVIPLAFGLVPQERKGKVITYIKNKRMAGSVYMAQYLMEALYLAGEEDYALELMTSKEKRSWYNMIRVGSTITLEAWDDAFKPNQDWNHAWGAVPGNIVGRFLLGVKPISAGFNKIEIAPQPSTLKFAQGRVPTIKGPVSITIKQSRPTLFVLETTLPGNTEAYLKLPLREGKKVLSVKANSKAVPYTVKNGRVHLAPFKPGTYKVEMTLQ